MMVLFPPLILPFEWKLHGVRDLIGDGKFDMALLVAKCDSEQDKKENTSRSDEIQIRTFFNKW